jgi:hypothetical protein
MTTSKRSMIGFVLLAAVMASASAQSIDDLRRAVGKARDVATKARQRGESASPADSRQPAAPAAGGEQITEPGGMVLMVEKNYSSWDNPLHSELMINDQLVNIFTSNTVENVDQYIREGWNTIRVKTTAQEPANDDNGLIFRIGRAYTDARTKKKVIDPLLWEFRNDTDWKYREDGTYLHASGPGVKEVTLEMRVYFAGVDTDTKELNAGDVVLRGKGTYGSWNAPVTATVLVNGTPLNTFTTKERTVVITPFLKKGRNEIKLVSSRIDHAIADNDIEFEILGPAVWSATDSKYMLKPILQFKSLQGWSKDKISGRLVNRAKTDAGEVERVIPLILKDDAES